VNSFANLILPLAVKESFSYLIPEGLKSRVQVGSRVLVQFGKSRFYTAIVHKVHTDEPIGELKEIEDVLDDENFVTASQLQLWEWIAAYYMCTLGEVYLAAVPSIFRLSSETILEANEGDLSNLRESELMLYERIQSSKKLKLKELQKEVKRSSLNEILSKLMQYGLVEDAELIREKASRKVEIMLGPGPKLSPNLDLDETFSRAPAQKKALESFMEAGEDLGKSSFLKKAKVGPSVLKRLLEDGYLTQYEQQFDLFQFKDEPEELKELNEEQTAAYSTILDSWKDKDCCLLQGVTSSGKTEVYFKLIQRALESEGQSLYLVPEIALSSQMIHRIELHFGAELAVFHSKLKAKERAEAWRKCGSGEAKVILGARSSVFLPFKKLSLIIVDEEHDASYKQQDPAPRYHARDLALVLAKFSTAKVLLGSATPSLESIHQRDEGSIGFAQLKSRYGGSKLPEIKIVDLKEEHRKKRMKELMSKALYDSLSETLAKSEQGILFQNRRGYSPFVQCENCGDVPECPSCDISLTYHRHSSRLRCHYCGYQKDLQSKCEKCNHPSVLSKGFGTEQIEQVVGMLFPEAKVLRMDYDTTRTRLKYEKIIERFSAGDADILVGTQMVTKGLDFDKVHVVGVLQVDQMLHFPDFRAHERAIQILLQVSGRSGRRSEQGIVFLQSYEPDHPILRFVKMSAFEDFIVRELKLRKEFHYPPFYRMIRLVLKSRRSDVLDQACRKLADKLKFAEPIEMLGPEIPGVARIRNFYLQQILFKFPRTVSPSNLKKNILARIEHSRMNKELDSVLVQYDVDPFL
jgi:primosomal protein N' (replication factor Y)